MPEMTGLELQEKLLKQGYGPPDPVLVSRPCASWPPSASYFEFLSARDVLDRGGLTTDEKIALLRECEQDVRELMVAEEENMRGDQTSDQALGDELRDIHAALASLGADRRAAAAPTKHG